MFNINKVCVTDSMEQNHSGEVTFPQLGMNSGIDGTHMFKTVKHIVESPTVNKHNRYRV
jgi:hypothetical protein